MTDKLKITSKSNIMNETNRFTVMDRVRIRSTSDAGIEMNLKNRKWDKEVGKSTVETKLYKRRWLQLGLFSIYAAVNTMQWIQFTIIANIISRYYSVSSSAIDWTSIIFYVTFVVLLFPASYVMNHDGLRWMCLIGSIGTSIGAWIKYLSVSPDRFLFVFIGQTVVASSQVFVLPGPAILAAVWFGPQEVATATAIGCFGGLAGVSIIFLITPMIVKNHERVEEIGQELSTFFLAVAIVCTLVALALFSFFQDEPKIPPSNARALQKSKRKFLSKGFWLSMREILTNKTFFMLWNSYGINLGSINAVSTLLNPLLLAHFENGETDAGKLGLLMNLSGNFGSIIFCVILDKTKKFKALSIFIYAFTLVGEIFFAIGLIMEIKWLVFVSVTVIGVFSLSYGSIGFELSAEATYPEPEDLSSGLLNMSQQLYGIILSLIVGSLLRTYGDIAAHAFITASIAIGLTLTLFNDNELRRQNAEEKAHYKTGVLLEAVKSNHIQERDKKKGVLTLD